MKTQAQLTYSINKTTRADSLRWFQVSGLVMAGLGMCAYLGYSLSSAPEGITQSEEKAERRGHLTHQFVTSAHNSATCSNQANLSSTIHSSHTFKLSELVQKLAIANTPEEKRAIADALIALGSEEALRAWGEALLKETDPAIRAAMLEALDNLNGEAAVEMLTQLVALSDAPEILDAVSRTLARMANPETIRYLAEIHAAAVPGDAQQARVLRILGAISNPAAVPGLIHIAHQPALGAEVTGQAFNSLGKIGDPASLIAMTSAFNTLTPEDFAQRQQIVQSIAAITNPASLAMLEDLALNNPQPLIASAAADALKTLPQALPIQSNQYVIPDIAALPPPQDLIAK